MKKISILALSVLLAACSSGTYTTDVNSDTYKEDYNTAKLSTASVPAEQLEVSVVESAPEVQQAAIAPEPQIATPVQAEIKPAPVQKRVVKISPANSAKKVRIVPPTQKQLERTQRFGYTLQVIALDSPYKSRTYADQLPSGNPVWEHFKRVNGTDWYAILYGDYATKSEAKAAIQTLPEFFRSKNPFVKSLDKIKNSAYPKLNKLR
ncbi:cytochrome C biogenesis protein CcdA [Vibrio albus]|jgi:septal ring-binding cell division protein DamX|uniref:Cytochrome C biogenesis protein CcdA n=1 Tax=Vibrio albus TaxID=2200953 RepID=A0A2U3B5Z6_9VIBR|nr:SPOR domain-containing protein [Vibrio albus]PWI32221.1 cytochrome C biogenesis protein CcdA [Vibrio albus]